MSDAQSPQRAANTDDSADNATAAHTEQQVQMGLADAPKQPRLTMPAEYYVPLSRFIICFALIILLFTGAFVVSTLSVLLHDAPWKIGLGALIAAVCLYIIVSTTIALARHAHRPL